MKKLFSLLIFGGAVLLFLPIWVGSTNLMPVGMVMLIAGFLVLNKILTGSFFRGGSGGDDYKDRLDRMDDWDNNSDDFSGGGGESGGGGASGDWGDSDDD